jgi:ATP-binding protein involved in chromosome partitioning
MSDGTEALERALAGIGEGAERISAPRLKDGNASLVLDVTGLDSDERAGLERRIRSALVAVPGVGEVRIAMTAEKVGRTIVAVGSGKGGVGKSTVAANLAIALARSGRKVGLVDADIYGPSLPRIMGNHERPELDDKRIVPVDAWGVKMLSIGQLVEAGTALAWRGPMVASALGQLMEGDWEGRDLMVVDLPPGTGDIQMSLIQKWKPAGAVIVSTPQDLALIDATRAIDLFRKMHVPVIGLIENMSGFACPHCGEVSDPFGSGGAEAAAKVMSIPFLGRIPLALSIRRSSDAGAPLAAGEGEEAAIFAALAQGVLAQLATAAAG